MDAAHIMATNVITVGPDARVEDVADLLIRNRISAVPVVDKDGTLLGIVSEGDLIRRPESDTERRPSSWLEFFSSKESLATAFIRSHSRKVTDVMTRDVITATPSTSVGELAALLEKHRIKRVPIVKAGKVVGIVSRANLLQALASLKTSRLPTTVPDDEAIREKIIAQLNRQAWAHPSLLNVTIQDGTVDLWGVVDSDAEKNAVYILAETTLGVRAVNDNLTVWPTDRWG